MASAFGTVGRNVAPINILLEYDSYIKQTI
jgi:hypothetical protein